MSHLVNDLIVVAAVPLDADESEFPLHPPKRETANVNVQTKTIPLVILITSSSLSSFCYMSMLK